MKHKKTRTLTTVIIMLFLLGVLIGIWGEIMPDSIQASAKAVARFIGISYDWFWSLVILLFVALSTALLWWQVKQEQNLQKTETPITTRKVKQTGEKAIYIEKNEGDIHIK